METRSFVGVGGNCVLDRQQVDIDPAKFTAPGLYTVLAGYSDGNSDAAITDDWIGTNGQQVFLDVR